MHKIICLSCGSIFLGTGNSLYCGICRDPNTFVFLCKKCGHRAALTKEDYEPELDGLVLALILDDAPVKKTSRVIADKCWHCQPGIPISVEFYELTHKYIKN